MYLGHASSRKGPAGGGGRIPKSILHEGADRLDPRPRPEFSHDDRAIKQTGEPRAPSTPPGVAAARAAFAGEKCKISPLSRMSVTAWRATGRSFQIRKRKGGRVSIVV